MTIELTTKNTMAEIVAAYNSMTEMTVKKFSTKQVGLDRIAKLSDSLPVAEEVDSVQSQVLSPISDAKGLFSTDTAPLFVGDFEVPDKKAVMNTDDNRYIATVGNGYKVINNREAFTHFANVLADSEINTSGMIVSPTITDSKCFVTFRFPEHKVEVREGDITELQIVAKNSYDGSTRFSLEIGGFRLLCSNGQGIGSYSNVFNNKHSSGYDENHMAKYLRTAITTFTEAGEEWKKWTEIAVTDSQALKVVAAMVEKKTDKSYEEIMEGKQSVLKESLMIWERYKAELGSNKFGLYNTITHLSSHAETKDGNVVGHKSHKAKMRDKTLSHSNFRNLQAA